nr:uncharacterized protein LOC109746131 [Aegilops tauschii subsp. strangulata]
MAPAPPHSSHGSFFYYCECVCSPPAPSSASDPVQPSDAVRRTNPLQLSPPQSMDPAPDPGSSLVHRPLLAPIPAMVARIPESSRCATPAVVLPTSPPSLLHQQGVGHRICLPLFAAPLFLFCSSLSIILKFSEIHARRITRCRPPCMPPRMRGAVLCREVSTPASAPVHHVVAFNCLSSSLMSPSSPTSEALPSLDPGIPGPCRRDTDINVPFPDHLEGGGRPCLSLQSARWASAAHRRQRWIQGAPVQSTAWVHAACRHSPLQSIMWVQPIAACSSAHGHMKRWRTKKEGEMSLKHILREHLG